jgi:HEPN domain-containing protein
MSSSKKLHEANRWWQTARDDLKAARTLEQAGMFAHACFECQQCGEKAIKALYFFIEADPWGHSIQKLVEEFPEPTWLKPREQSYAAEDVSTAIERASFLLEEARRLFPEE